MKKKHIYYCDLPTGPYCKKNCIFCMEGGIGQREMVSIEKLELMYKNNFIEKLVLTSGEPLLNKDILKYIEMGVKYGSKVALVTSGDEILLRESFLEKLLKVGLSEIMFSLEGPEKIHDYLVQYKGAYKIIMKSLYELSLLKKKYNFSLVVNTNINLINYKFLPKFIIKILVYFKVDIYHLQWLEYLGNAVKNFSRLFAPYSKLLYYINNDSELLKYKDKLKFGRVPYCVLNKNLHSCVTLTNYDIFDGEDFFNYMNEKVVLPQCEKCTKLGECELFYKYYVEKFGGGEAKPILN